LISCLAVPLSASCDAAGVDSSAPLLTVAELEPRIDELNGDSVRVAGYLGPCAGYDCVLYRTKEDSEMWDRTMAAVHRNKKVPIPDLPSLGIGSGEDFEFDAKAAPFVRSYVVITGTVTNECRFKGRPSCTDRGPDLKPIHISSWKGAIPPASQRGASSS
jgi:hypothetical protein